MFRTKCSITTVSKGENTKIQPTIQNDIVAAKEDSDSKGNDEKIINNDVRSWSDKKSEVMKKVAR